MNINIEKTPFSSKGAYLAIQKSPSRLGAGIWLRSLIRPEWGIKRKKVSDQILRFIPTDYAGIFINYKTICTPECLRFESNFGYVNIFFNSIASVKIETHNMGLVLEHDYDDSNLVNIEVDGNTAKGYLPITFFDLKIDVSEGNLRYNKALKRFFITGEEGAKLSIFAWHRFVKLPDDLQIIENKDIIKKNYEQFRKKYKPANKTEELAVYTLWSGEYEKCGNLTRNITAISKGLMNNVWSWDNCFIAMAASLGDKKLARDNIMIFFDLQLKDGRLLDAVNPFIKVDWYTKPPIHGFFITKMLDDAEIFDMETLKDLYPKLILLSEWWDKNTNDKGLYFYKDPYDSGWDNATCFDKGMPVYSPDLNAYMVLLYQCINKVAILIEKSEQASFYKKKMETLINNMVKYMYDGQQFLCLNGAGVAFETTSLIKMVPIILGKLLPTEVFENLAKEISRGNHFLTEASLATESVASEYYDQRKGDIGKPNAYWRGPVWAPPLYCIVDGLIDAGYNKLAEKIAQRYIGLIENTPDAFYENYDAILKTGYDDTGYMWTVAVYLLLKQHMKKK